MYLLELMSMPGVAMTWAIGIVSGDPDRDRDPVGHLAAMGREYHEDSEAAGIFRCRTLWGRE